MVTKGICHFHLDGLPLLLFPQNQDPRAIL
jgi:hypothetical protein